MSIAEAQGAGVGVCMANIRPDLREYVGPAGFFVRLNQPSAKDHIQTLSRGIARDGLGSR
jgi:hypothetical protein